MSPTRAPGDRQGPAAPAALPVLPPTDYAPRPYAGPSRQEVIELRRRHLQPGMVTYYDHPVMIVEGRGQYLWDETGRRYLDGLAGIATVNVGHCHPSVVAAGQTQLATLQHASTIYLHPNVALYGRELAARLPGELHVCLFVNSGSEANDLALLLARLATGNHEIIALRGSYHGGGAATLAITGQSTWKPLVPAPAGVHHARCPDPYRGPWPSTDPEAATRYAEDVLDLIGTATPGRIAGFIAESIQGVNGAVEYPAGYLAAVYAHVRAAGGVCIADEVQTGFGRTGDHFWGFQAHGVTPDIVVMAKGIGNGAPLAAVVTTQAIAARLAERIHFNTFGGNPVSCAMGRAVLEVLDREGLQENARNIGQELRQGLQALAARHDLIGNVRGRGLMLGIELVTDRRTRAPATQESRRVLERCRELGLLLGKGGRWGQVLRVKPPLCLTRADAQFLLAALDEALKGV